MKRSLKAYISLFTAVCFLLCTVGIFTAAAETGTDNGPIETGYIFDDAVDINPETNSNIRASSNLSAQNWGDFDDKSFFGMNGGSSGDDTFVIVQTPPERYFNYFSVNTYRYDGVKEDYGIYISADDNYYSPLSVSFSSAQSGHGGFARCTYTSAVMPAGMRYIKIVFPQDKENWKLMVSSFSIGWTSSPTGESAEQIPVSAADNHIRTRVIDDASALEGDATNIISSVNVKTARFNGLTDESVIQPSLSSAQAGECYIVLKAPQGTNITDITVTSEHYGELSGSFYIYESSELTGNYTSVEASIASAPEPSGWEITSFEGKPQHAKYVKIAFPQFNNSSNIAISSISYVCESDDPAEYAKPSGELSIQGDNFVDGQGRIARFWGVNTASFYPTHTVSDSLAENLESLEINLVRHHHNLRNSADWNWGTAPVSLINYSSGSTRNMDPEAWDRFDYFNSSLASRDIYYNFSIESSRGYLPGDNSIISGSDAVQWASAISALNNLDWRTAIDLKKLLPMIDERALELNKEFAEYFLTHVNPYSGVAYKDDPYLLTIELSNETSSEYAIVCGNTFNDKPGLEYFRDKLYGKWNSYISENSYEYFDLYSPVNQTQIQIRAQFLRKLDEDYTNTMKDFIKNTLGCDKPVAFSNLWRGENATAMNFDNNDFIENHTYSNPMIADTLSDCFGDLSKYAPNGKPYFIGEYNVSEGSNLQDPYRSMLVFNAGVYGSFNNYSGIEYFALTHGSMSIGDDGWAPDESRTPDEDDRIGSLIKDSVFLDHLRTGGIIYKNGYLSQSVYPFVVTVDEPYYAGYYDLLMAGKYTVKDGWQSIHSIKKQFADAGAQMYTAQEMQTSPNQSVLVSDTGQIAKDLQNRQISFSTEYAEGFSGFLNGASPVMLNRIDLGNDSGFATVMMTSNDGAVLSESKNIVISRTVLDAGNNETSMPITLTGLKKAVNGVSKWVMKTTRGSLEEVELEQQSDGSILLPADLWYEAELSLVESDGITMLACSVSLDGESVSSLASDMQGMISAEITLSADISLPADSIMVIALYEDNRLCALNTAKTEIVQGVKKYQLPGIQKTAGEGSGIKIFVWNSDMTEYIPEITLS